MNSGSSASISSQGQSVVMPGRGQFLVVPDVAAFGPGDLGAGVLDHDARLDRGALGHGGVGSGLERGRATATQAGVGGDHDAGLGVDGAVAQSVGREAAEHNAVDGADAGAGQHGDGKLGDHGQVDDDPVALLDALLLEDVGELGDFFPQLSVGDGAGRLRGVAFEVVGHLVGCRGVQMPVEAVVATLSLPPSNQRTFALAKSWFWTSVPLLEPVQSLLGLLGPEGVGVVQRAPVHLLILLHARDPGGLLELGRNVENLARQGIRLPLCPPVLPVDEQFQQRLAPTGMRGLAAKHV